MSAEPTTLWVRVHKSGRLVLRYAPGSIDADERGLKVKAPNVLLGVVRGDTKAYFALTAEEALRLAETLKIAAVRAIKEEEKLQQVYEAKMRELREKQKEPTPEPDKEEIAEYL